MKNLPVGLHVLIALAIAAPAQAAISLTGTIRDFNASSTGTGLQPGTLTPHPDFQVGSDFQVRTGMVASTLTNGRPVFIGTPGSDPVSGYVTSVDSFDQWYKDVTGINRSSTLTISLDETVPGSGVFQYATNSFFPIDGPPGPPAPVDHQGLDHNFHFTYHIHAQFTYAAGQTFSFEGDDDVWVFFNGKLAIDLGGIHPVGSASVSLDAVAGQLGLAVGMAYDFDFFFAERHTSISNFKISTTIPLRVPDPNPDPNPSVPEPASLTIWSLLCVGLGCAAARRRRVNG